MADLMHCLRQARTDQCGLDHARRVVAARADRGDYDAIVHGELSADMREAMAMALWREVKEER